MNQQFKKNDKPINLAWSILNKLKAIKDDLMYKYFLTSAANIIDVYM